MMELMCLKRLQVGLHEVPGPSFECASCMIVWLQRSYTCTSYPYFHDVNHDARVGHWNVAQIAAA